MGNEKIHRRRTVAAYLARLLLVLFGIIGSAMTSSSFAAERIIHYERTEFHFPNPEPRVAPLSVFVYDIPYFDACGIFPPFQVINQIFSSGGGDGGMSPGAIWHPFTISREEYSDLVKRVEVTDPATLKGKARFIFFKFGFDPAFDGIQDHMAWFRAACDKHRETYFSANEERSKRFRDQSR